MFKEVLKDLVEKSEGGIAGIIMDAEGIALDSYSKPDAAIDINTVAVEYGVILGTIKRTAESLEAGEAKEIAITTEKSVTLIRTLGNTYFLALSMKPDGNLGKGRFLMRTSAPKLMAELA
jgi:predicted regulator of Ras-like GTPase activity (Roadblock/LC7/MglB family)